MTKVAVIRTSNRLILTDIALDGTLLFDHLHTIPSDEELLKVHVRRAGPMLKDYTVVWSDLESPASDFIEGR